MISPPLDGLYHYKRTVELSIESVRSAPHRVRFAPQNHPLYSADCSDRAEGESSAVAEGILDRIINNKYSIEVKGRISMRKRHAFSNEESGVNNNG